MHTTKVIPLALAALSLGIGACSMSLSAPRSSRSCAETVASALASPARPVAGAYRCLSPQLQANLQGATGEAGDVALQQIAKSEPVYTSASPRGRTGDGSYLFVLDGSANGSAVSQAVLVRLDRSGHVAAIASAP